MSAFAGKNRLVMENRKRKPDVNSIFEPKTETIETR